MNTFFKRPRLRLPPGEYQKLRNQVLKRDNWRCQHCGKSTDLQIHHIKHRSQLGSDAQDNLITLCFTCHTIEHGS